MSTPASTPLYHTGHLLRRAQQLHQALWNREVSADLSSVQYAALLVVTERPGISQAQLCDELDLDRSTIADLVERMARRDLLAREQSTTDRRRNVLTVTPTGAQVLRDTTPAVERVDHALAEPLTAAETEQLRALLRRMLAHGVDVGALRH